MEPFIGEVRLLPYTFAPRGWALCNGQLLPISQNTALFSVIGVTYGGNGKTNFALPNLQGRVVPGAGRGPGLQNWEPGAMKGQDSVTLTTEEMPLHSHNLSGLNLIGNTSVSSADTFLGQDRRGGQGNIQFLTPPTTEPDTMLAQEALTYTGENQPHENRQPFLSLNFCIALQGIFPSRG